MIEQIDLQNVLFLDIETAARVHNYEALDEPFKSLWDKKHRFYKDSSAEEQYSKAGVFAEFSKIICICVGYFNDGKFRLKSFYGDDEKEILLAFKALMDKHFGEPHHLLCAHNGKEFDFPFICRRMLVHGISIPAILRIQGKKPWEVQHLDTMELWKFGDYKSFTSLQLLAAVFNIPTPKDDIDGSQVGHVYHIEKNLERIKTYCEKDVVTVARLFQKMRAEQPLAEEQIIYTN